MNLADRQLLDTKDVNEPLNISFNIVVLGEHRKNAINSIREQLYTNYIIKEINIYEEWDENDKKIIANVIKNSEEDYVIFLNGEDRLTSNALLEYARKLSYVRSDVVYADEGVWTNSRRKDMNYVVKPKAEPIAYFQNMFVGRAVVFNTNAIKTLLDDIESYDFDSMMIELFYKVLINKGSIENIPLILCVKQYRPRCLDNERSLEKHLRNAIAVNEPEWIGVLSKAKSYNPYAWELQSNRLVECDFVVFSSNVEDTIQLLSQIRISYSNEHVVVVAKEEYFEGIRQNCTKYGISNVKFIEARSCINSTLEAAKESFLCDNQIVICDTVKWLNRMNVETLKQCFYKGNVKLAIPQIATEGDNPKMIYGGDDIDSLSLTGNYYKGRVQGIEREYDLQWTNRRVVSINEYVFLIRKDTWDELLPINDSIKTFRHLAIELSLKCIKHDILCEYSAQSCFWVKSEVENYYSGKSKDNKNGWESEPRLSGCYIHWLKEYGEFIGKIKSIPYGLQSYKPYIKENFKTYFLENFNNTNYNSELQNLKRVLVFTHELSLTGAPIVLVQAVSELVRMGYLPLVVSPVDGPLKREYGEMNVPVIIEPRLYENYEYIHVAYDFDFVFACTICLWQVVEQLGKTEIPVLWWIHDSEMGYKDYLRYVLPDDMPSNIHIYAGGDYAQRVIKKYRPRYNVDILLYGLEDFALDLPIKREGSRGNLPNDKIVFANIAQIISRKGQDIMVSAIRKLPDYVIKKSFFVFVGGVVDRKIYNQIIELCNEYPQSVKYIKQISHSELKQFYREVDALICSSIDDPLPAFIAEGMMMSDVCICSRNTAFNSIIESGVSGYLFESGNVDELAKCICNVVMEREKMASIKENARKVFVNTFSLDVFRKELEIVLEEQILR